MKIFYILLCIALIFCAIDIESYITEDKEFAQKYKNNIGNLDLLFLIDNTGISTNL